MGSKVLAYLLFIVRTNQSCHSIQLLVWLLTLLSSAASPAFLRKIISTKLCLKEVGQYLA